MVKSSNFKKILIGVSGGPDSMLLLYESLQKYGSQNIVVACVNYNVRENTHLEVKIVRDFCIKNNIIFALKNLDKNIYKKGNFENWARFVRYDFYKQLVNLYNLDVVFLAHHKDDFIESYFMQKNSNRKCFFYGIKQENFINGIKIFRPFINKYFKKEILEICKLKDIHYAIDPSNNLNLYTRNKIRNSLKDIPLEEKEQIYNDILEINRNSDFYAVNKLYKSWQNHNFSQEFFVESDKKDRLVYMFIHKNYKDINLSSSKINSIIDWIVSNKNRTSKYLIKKDIYLIKIKGKLFCSYMK
ncbi:tRNA lysidine(34) synthetase TilS [Mycoplasmopsis lipofaciens]|uniref:tRNA lysidine(34) synthetase TilS n=1 Tax=Mycoplasmopsis lipofaciens TaxID=114884 RepID=UPI00048531C3|nr:tRNA lysidine(34) synthetase TilS [Mycoplasmopsis lipofaciens]